MKKVKKKIGTRSLLAVFVALVATGICGWVMNYFFMPAITFSSMGFWFFGLILLFEFFAVLLISGIFFDLEWAEIGFRIGMGAVVLDIVVMIIMAIASGQMANAKNYQKLADVNVAEFSEDFVDISENDVPISSIDFDTAKRMGNRTIGNIKHSSWYEVDSEFNLIRYNGEYYRISPLNYGGFFKYQKAINASECLPGYVLVNAQTGEAKFVEKNFRYSPSGFFGNNLTRLVHNAYPHYVLDTSYFEVDEEGNPYWITPVKTATIGAWGGRQVQKAIITDAVTGNSEEMALNDLPKWIDHAVSLEYCMDVAGFYYEYQDGYWNSVFSKTGVYKTSYAYRSSGEKDGDKFDGYNSLIGGDGEIYFYTGLTPANNAESNSGFLLINTRTGKVSEYKYSSANAAEESSAQKAAEGLVQNLGYTATFPTVVNVGGHQTYLMNLKDKGGLVQRYALCDIQNYSVTVEADNLNLAVEKFLREIGKNVSVEVDPEATKTERKRISEIYTAEIEGTTMMYYIFFGESTLYRCPITVNERQVLLKEADWVEITFVESGNIREITDMNVINAHE